MNPLFSILIPAYNAENYIKDCIMSCINQDKTDDVEILVANDGSTDDTREVCEEIANEYPVVSIFNKDNEGLYLTRKYLYQRAKGEYCIFLDADDLWEDNLLETLRNYIEQYHHPDILCFGFSTFNQGNITPYNRDEQKEKIYSGESRLNGISLFLTSDNYNSVCCKAIKRSILLRLILPEEWASIRQGEDKLLSIAAAEEAGSICVIPDHLYLYRTDNTSMTRSFNPTSFQEIIIVDAFVLSKLERLNCLTSDKLTSWAVTLVDKFFNYLINLDKADIDNVTKGKWFDKYIHESICNKAFNICWKSGSLKYKIKSIIVRNQTLFHFIRSVYQSFHV